MSAFASALAHLPAALQPEVSAYWHDYLAAAERAGLAPPENPDSLERIARVWAMSEFVARSCIREPALLAALLPGGELAAADASGVLAARCRPPLAEAPSEEALAGTLRRLRRREMVRIAWRDLAGEASLEETLEALSELADVLVDAALDWHYQRLCQRFGVPRDAEGRAQHLVVLGMGKLGGRELNYSSDIDLIFAYPDKGETDGARGLSNEEFFRRLGQALIRALDTVTAEGFVFRVDLRLRPFGEAGPLVMPFSALEDYYQQHGREWERYAMIKARVIAGDREAGARLLESLRPFVYRRYLDYGAIEALREMKVLIAREVARKGLRRNVKLGPGGIREIEFIAQAFQLIYGGRDPGLRSRSLFAVLDHLAASGRLPRYAVEGLKRAYVFLRRTENRLQAYADQQTHNLPEDERGKLRLAFAMGFDDWQAYVHALMRHVRFVTGQFEQVFAAPQAESETTPAASAAAAPAQLDFTAVWNGSADAEALQAFLAEQGYRPPQAALASLEQLRQGRQRLGKQGQRRLDQLMPLLLGAVAASADPVVTLERLTRLIEAIARRSVYLALLVENPVALSQLVKLCAASGWIAQHVARYPLLLDELIVPASLYAPLERARLSAELERELQRLTPGDEEQRLDALRHFKHTNVLRVAAADVSGAMPLMIVSDHLTEIAEVLLSRILALAWEDLLARFGRPRYRLGGEWHEAGFAIIGYGKLGGIELGYGSDLDLVFLHDSCGEEQLSDGPRSIDNASFFAKLAQRVIHLLTTPTAAGVLYEVDTRLRPSGRAGLLVSSLDAFTEYQRHQAWTWEHQALVRARPIAGSAHIAAAFQALRREILGRQRDREALRREVREMRERMRRELSRAAPGRFDLKQDRGGITDIEFITQYLVLAHTGDEPILARFTDNIRQLAGLEATGILSSWDAGLLRDTYRALRKRIHLLKLQEQPALVDEAELRELRNEVKRIWHQVMEEGKG